MQSDDKTYVTLGELCEILSVSQATGRNWVKLGKIVPQAEEHGTLLFTQEYAGQLKEGIAQGKIRALRNRRNKQYVSGSSVYESYVPSASANVQEVRRLMGMVLAGDKDIGGAGLSALLAECALQLIVQRECIQVPAPFHLLAAYLKGGLSLKGYGFLIDDLLADRAEALAFAKENAELFAIEYRYEESEDILGLLYISCKNLGKRKATGSYYTPTAVVEKIVGRVFADGANGGKVCDPCCGSGNFLLRLPKTVGMEDIYGNDIDRTGICLARINLALKFRRADKDILYGQLTAGDYLQPGRPADFDYIIGNPPWGFRFAEEEKKRLRDRYRCAVGNMIESYDVVTEQAVTDLKPGGVLAFVLPEAVLNVKSHMMLRQFLLEECSFQYLEYLGDVFTGVACPSIILQVQRTQNPASCVGMSVKHRGRGFTILEERSLRRECLNFTATDEEYRILQKIAQMPQQATLAGRAKFALGIVTGNNGRYVSKVKGDGMEAVLKGTDIQKFRFTLGGNYIAFKPEEFQQAAPTAYYRAEQKLLYRFISSRLVFAYDDRQTLPLNSCNVLIPEIEGLQMKYILAVLNSRAAQFFFDKNFNSLKILRSHIEQIPIPQVGRQRQEEIVQIVNRLIEPPPGSGVAEDSGPSDAMMAEGFGPSDAMMAEGFGPSDAMVSEDFEALDAMVAEDFGLSQEEYGIVKESVEALRPPRK